MFRCEGPPPCPVEGGEAFCCVSMVGFLHDSALQVSDGFNRKLVLYWAFHAWPEDVGGNGMVFG